MLNKIDGASTTQLDAVLNRYPNAIAVSAKTGEGFENLHRGASDALSRFFRDVDIEFDISNGKLLAFLSAKGEVLSTKYGESSVKVHVRIPQKYLGRITDDAVVISEHVEDSEGSAVENNEIVSESAPNELSDLVLPEEMPQPTTSAGEEDPDSNPSVDVA